MDRQYLRPYAALAVIEHVFDTDHLDIWIVFKFPMLQDVKPDNVKWICKVEEVVKDVTASAWQDEFTLKLTVADIATRPDKVTIEYDGPDLNLITTWFKQWEPWGAIVSTEIPPVSTTRTFTTGPTAQDDVDIANVNVLFLDCSGNSITIGGFVGGINGQVLHIARIEACANTVKLEHNEGTGNQDIMLHAGIDESLGNEFGGWNLVCDGTTWYDCSHAKHV